MTPTILLIAISLGIPATIIFLCCAAVGARSDRDDDTGETPAGKRLIEAAREMRQSIKEPQFHGGDDQ